MQRLTRYPVAAAQALRVRNRALRLPEPPGPRAGLTGCGAPLRLLIFGDSSAAGVGVEHQDDALTGHLVNGLAPVFSVNWQLVARSGATTRWGAERLRAMEPGAFDAAVLSLGINDVKNAMPQWAWARNMHEILSLLSDRHGVDRIYWSAMPPIGRFPLLPDPLRSILGERGARFDSALAGMMRDWPGGRHIPFDFELDESHMARDGFHPGPMIYAHWGDRVAEVIRAERESNVGTLPR